MPPCESISTPIPYKYESQGRNWATTLPDSAFSRRSANTHSSSPPLRADLAQDHCAARPRRAGQIVRPGASRVFVGQQGEGDGLLPVRVILRSLEVASATSGISAARNPIMTGLWTPARRRSARPRFMRRRTKRSIPSATAAPSAPSPSRSKSLQRQPPSPAAV